MTPRDAVTRCVERCAPRAWRLASALAADPTEAQDVVQQACLVLARKAERVARCDDPWPFFAGVIAHEARNARRKKRPSPHDDASAPEAVDARAVDPARAAQVAEERARVEAALAELPDAQREAVLLTHLGGLTQAEAAVALDLPTKTLGSHVKRGLDRLRARLGARDEATVVGGLALVGASPPPGGLEALTAVWREAALAALGKGGGAAAAIGGGAVSVKQSSALVVGVLSLVTGLAGGVVLDRAALAPDEPSRALADVARPASRVAAPAATPTAAPTAPVADAAPRVVAPVEPDPAVVRERDALRAQVAALEAELGPIRAAREARRPTFTFGKAGREGFVVDADWLELARAHRTMSSLMPVFLAAKRGGEPPSKELELQARESQERLRLFELSARGALGSTAMMNGEMTHPLTIANIVAALLAEADRPLAPGQVDRIAVLGEAFERDLGAARAARLEGQPRLLELLDEFVAKDRFRDGLLDALDPAQRALIIAPQDRERIFRDLWDPTMMLLRSLAPIEGGDLAEIARALHAWLGKRLGLDEATRGRAAPLVDAWARDVQGAVCQPVAEEAVPPLTCDAGRIAIEAAARLYAAIAALLPEGERAALLDETDVPFPQLVRRD